MEAHIGRWCRVVHPYPCLWPSRVTPLAQSARLPGNGPIVRASSYWPQIRDVVQPPGTAIHRSRPPLGLLLYAAARDGRLVWQSANEFAVIEPPIGRIDDWARSDAGRTWLVRLDRRWENVMFGAPPLLVMLLSVPVAFIPMIGVLCALTLVAMAVLYLVLQMAVGVVRLLGQFRASPEGSARGVPLDYHALPWVRSRRL
jgi:hypothetical protein